MGIYQLLLLILLSKPGILIIFLIWVNKNLVNLNFILFKAWITHSVQDFISFICGYTMTVFLIVDFIKAKIKNCLN